MKKEYIIVLCIFFATLLFFSCKKKSIDPSYTKAKITIQMTSGANAVIWDSLNYTNAAGNKFSVSTANFFISGIVLKSATKTYASNKVFYIDAKVSSKAHFWLDSIPPNDYTEISFYLGLDKNTNKSNSLPATVDNSNMAWPDLMGGGYHFLKLEGTYLDSANVTKGYAIHLGRNENLVSAKITQNLHQQYWNHEYKISFNVNEVFTNPTIYDLNFEKNYTMSDSLAMLKIKNNMNDVFTIIQNN
ncbi:MAG: hypothetical protein IPM51_01580 [Sphingobacteriaceae bacterium]|nr:hypothetical protein [Sphingobacteriaceae bacterium]